MRRIRQDVNHHAFIQRSGKNAVNAGKIHNRSIDIFTQFAFTPFFVERDARVVSHMLSQTGKVIKERTLAGVGIPYECDFSIHA
jgi:hypothetical protein